MAGFGFIYGLFMLILVVELWLVFRPQLVELANSRRGFSGLLCRVLCLGNREVSPGARAADARVIAVLAVAGIPVVCILTGYVGFLFATVKGNPWWSTALLPVIFLISGILSGSAVVLLLYVVLGWWQGTRPDAGCLRALSQYVWGFLALVVALELLELGHMAYEAEEEWPVLSRLITDHLAVSLGLVQLLIGSLIPLVLLLIAVQPRINPRLAQVLGAVSALLVLVQVFAMRWNVVIGGQLFSKSFRGFVEYTVPWGGREGLIAATVVLLLPLLALGAFTRFLPLWPEHAARGTASLDATSRRPLSGA
jgi:formate-dependent nitrite reductase membrane component NrfD